MTQQHTNLGQCSNRVSHAGDLGFSRCRKKATVVVNDTAYCTIHSPDYVAKKQVEHNQRYEARWAAHRAIDQAAVEMRRRAACYPELLAAAEAASGALHQFHPQQHHIPVGRGICEWGPCQALFKAIAKASPQAR